MSTANACRYCAQPLDPINDQVVVVNEDTPIEYAHVQCRLGWLFNPGAVKRLAGARAKRFVHYTQADAAMSILKDEVVWMRNASCMNDFTEVEHGLNCLSSAYRANGGSKFKGALDRIFDGARGELEALFDRWVCDIRWNIYITCVSEHVMTRLAVCPCGEPTAG